MIFFPIPVSCAPTIANTTRRTLDMRHIAIAVPLGAKEFLAFTARQKKLAQAAGLKTPL